MSTHLVRTAEEIMADIADYEANKRLSHLRQLDYKSRRTLSAEDARRRRRKSS